MTPAAYLAEHGHRILSACRRELLSQAPRLSTSTVERLLRQMDTAARFLTRPTPAGTPTPLEERQAIDAAHALLLTCRWLNLPEAEELNIKLTA